jgi:hypothetical protein
MPELQVAEKRKNLPTLSSRTTCLPFGCNARRSINRNTIRPMAAASQKKGTVTMHSHPPVYCPKIHFIFHLSLHLSSSNGRVSRNLVFFLCCCSWCCYFFSVLNNKMDRKTASQLNAKDCKEEKNNNIKWECNKAKTWRVETSQSSFRNASSFFCFYVFLLFFFNHSLSSARSY